MGLVVDQPKQGGGNSNDGNTAIKFFENLEIVSENTSLEFTLLIRFSNILRALASEHYINVNLF